MTERKSSIERKTSETDIKIYLNIDGKGKSEISSGNGFLDHMLTLFARHGGFDMTVSCDGDTYVDFHHSAEDIGICLGRAFDEAVGDKRGIRRYSSIILPMDEALILAAVDISGRSFVSCDTGSLPERIGDFDTELTEEFFNAFAHHIIEGIFKAFARVLREALSIDAANADSIPSTKGVL